jgi:protein SCO1
MMPVQSLVALSELECLQGVDPERLLDLLDEAHPIYDQQTTRDVTQTRARILLALASRPLPDRALPFVLEELDTGIDPHLVAAAAIALRACPQPSPAFGPYIRRALENMSGHDDLISFESLSPPPATPRSTTPLRELQRTVEWLPGETDSTDCCLVSPILERLTRTSAIDRLVLEDQNGVMKTYRELFRGHPTVVAFFYTRCDNPLKCSLTVWKLARLQTLLAEQGAGETVHTAAITYDSEFDTPARLLRFGVNRGVRLDDCHRLLRVHGGIAPLRAHFRLGVNFFEGLVNRHRIDLFVLNPQGNVAGSYRRLQWDEREVCSKAISLLTPSRDRRVLSVTGPTITLFAALLPKCPFCWAAWLSTAGITSLNAANISTSVQLVLPVLLILNLTAVTWRARATGRGLPLVVAAIGSVCFASGAPYIGAALLGVSAALSSLTRRQPRQPRLGTGLRPQVRKFFQIYTDEVKVRPNHIKKT